MCTHSFKTSAGEKISENISQIKYFLSDIFKTCSVVLVFQNHFISITC